MGTYTGTPADETITPATVSASVDSMPPGSTPSAAADTINGGGGADSLDGGGGEDTVFVEYFSTDPYTFTGTSTLHGGGDDDRLYVLFEGPLLDIDGATFRLHGDAGNDRLEATYFYPWSQGPNYGAANDFLYGGTGDDTYVLQESSDAVIEKAGEGYDSVEGWGDDYTLAANVEKLQLFYGPDDAPQGFRGTGNGLDNVLIGTRAEDVLQGAGGDDTLYGKALGPNLDITDDADTIRGGAGNDTIYGGGGMADTWDDGDMLYGDGGDDTLFGQFGDDRMYGGTGNDVLGGQEGDDVMYGGAGDDTLGGGLGNDRLYGHAGVDMLAGREGSDKLNGGSGNDVFDYNDVSGSAPGAANRDVILDFTGAGDAVGDRIDLSGIDADATAGGNQAFSFVESITGVGQVSVVKWGGNTMVRANTAGSSAPELEILVNDGASLHTDWTEQDFIL